MSRRALLAIAMTVGMASCAATTPGTCELDEVEPPPELTCDAAVGAARDRLALLTGVASFDVRFGGFCPMDATCPDGVSDLTSARVIVRMEGSRDLTFTVTLMPGGTVRATDPIPAPGPPRSSRDGPWLDWPRGDTR